MIHGDKELPYVAKQATEKISAKMARAILECNSDSTDSSESTFSPKYEISRAVRRSKSSVRKPISLNELLIKDLGESIHKHLKDFESTVNQDPFLKAHSITGDYRAKMVDWMVEVLTTFKCSE